MFTVAVAGASGYAAQETLDRVLRHPELEVVALGSDSLAGRSASRARRAAERLAPAFRPERGGVGAQAPTWSSPASATSAPPGSSRRRTRIVVDLSGAHRLQDPALYPAWYGFDHPHPQSLAEWSYAVPELAPPTGRLIANPGCYATAALLALAPLAQAIEPASVVVDGKSGVSGAGRELKAQLARGLRARERLALPRRPAPARAGDRAAARLPGLLRAAPAARTPRSARHVLRAAARRRPARAARGRLRGQRRRARPPGRRRARAGARPGHRRRGDRRSSTDGATGRAVVVCAIDNLGKGAAGQAIQNANLALGIDETAGLRLAGVLV